MQPDSLEAYSGELAFFSVGQFNDPYFGNMKATGLIKPNLPSVSERSVLSNAEIRLKLVFEQDDIYGDSLSQAEFDLIEIDQIWRKKAWKLEQDVQLSGNPPVASFTVGQQDSMKVLLSDVWTQKYAQYFNSVESNRDSLYRFQFHGLAIVPKNESKIIPIEPQNTSFEVHNPNIDTFQVITAEWAYSLDRTGEQAVPSDNFKVTSTLEHFASFDMNLTKDDLGSSNISKVELVLYRNNQLMNQTINQSSASATRPGAASLRLHLLEPEFVSQGIDPGNPIAAGVYDNSDGGFHFDITSFVKSVILDGVDPQRKFYITYVNEGIIRPALLFNGQANNPYQPSIIVTSIKTGNE